MPKGEYILSNYMPDNIATIFSPDISIPIHNRLNYHFSEYANKLKKEEKTRLTHILNYCDIKKFKSLIQNEDTLFAFSKMPINEQKKVLNLSEIFKIPSYVKITSENSFTSVIIKYPIRDANTLIDI